MVDRKDTPQLRGYVGAWAADGCKPFVRIGVRCDFDMSLVTPRVRTKVIQGLRSGVLDSIGGSAKAVFLALSEAYGLRWVCASRTGKQLISGFRHHEFEQQLIALNALVTKHVKQNRIYNFKQGEGFCLWGWRAKDTAVRHLFAQIFIDDYDKELREKAIDFLSADGILTHSWVDKNPI
jgi:hypothetical protein